MASRTSFHDQGPLLTHPRSASLDEHGRPHPSLRGPARAGRARPARARAARGRAGRRCAGRGRRSRRRPVARAGRQSRVRGRGPGAAGRRRARAHPARVGRRGCSPAPRAARRPPVAGRPEPLSLDTLAAAVRDPRAGAVVTFSGVTRDVDHLDYEAYAEMAEAELARIAGAALERHGLCAVAVEHRVGAVPLSEASVLIAVSAPHRAEAFAGGREVIDEVKARAPIWKREEGEWKPGTTPPTG